MYTKQNKNKKTKDLIKMNAASSDLHVYDNIMSRKAEKIRFSFDIFRRCEF